MSGGVELAMRGPEAYPLARRALDEIERRGVWPTPLNFELWLHFLSEPESLLAVELQRLMDEGAVITDQVSEALAATYLPRARLSEEIRDAGALLSRELKSVATAISSAQKSQQAYGKTLAVAGAGLQTEDPQAAALQDLVATLSKATEKVQQVNSTLEQRLQDSTREVSRLREHLEQVRRDAMTDALTNLANRKALDENLQRAHAAARESGGHLSLAVVDIDHFKRFNDTFGHQTGDQVLRYVASVLGRVCAEPRFAARYGGEEFAMLFPSESAVDVESAVNAVREEIAGRQLRRRSTNDALGAVTISAGIAQLRPGETIAALIERADAALYTSKRTGRNRVTNAERLDRAA